MAAISPNGDASTGGDPPDTHLRGVARGGALNLAGAVVASVANVALILLITRQVAPDRAGSLFAVTSLFLIAATVARLGTTTGLVYWLARLSALDRHDELRRCLRIALVPVTVVGVVMAVTMLALAEPLGRMVGGDDPSAAVGYLRGLAVFLPLAALADALLAATRGLGRMRATVAVDKLSRPLTQVLLTAVVIAVAAPGLLAVAWAAPYAAAAVVSALWLGHVLRQRQARGVNLAHQNGSPVASPAKPAGYGALPSTPLAPREFWRYTAPRSAGTLVQLALQRLDIVLVAALSGPEAAAIYTAATRFVVVGQLGSQAVATAVEPRLAGLLAVGDREGAGRLYQLATGWLVLATWPLYLICLAFPAELVGLFGEGYTEGAPVVVLLALAMLLATACGMVDAMLNMAGKTVWTLVNSGTALVTMVVLDVALIPRFGVIGAAIGWAAAIAVNNLMPLTQLYVSFRLHPYGKESKAAIMSAAATLGVMPPLLALTGASTPLRLTSVLIGVVALVIVVIISRRTLALDAFVAALRPQQPGRSGVSVDVP